MSTRARVRVALLLLACLLVALSLYLHERVQDIAVNAVSRVNSYRTPAKLEPVKALEYCSWEEWSTGRWLPRPDAKDMMQIETWEDFYEYQHSTCSNRRYSCEHRGLATNLRLASYQWNLRKAGCVVPQWSAQAFVGESVHAKTLP